MSFIEQKSASGKTQEPAATVKVTSQEVRWQWRSRIKGGPWDAWERGRFGSEVPPFMEVEERQVFSLAANEALVKTDEAQS